jgi:RNA 2',3'-cyclic 3'-phosphodiesterase
MRLFFALWPDAMAAQAMWNVGRSLQSATSGRLTRLASIHMTLVFIGEVPNDRVDEVVSAGRRVNANAFTLMIDRLGYWPHNRLVWAGPSSDPANLVELVQTLQENLGQSGFALEPRAFKAHTTLIRNAQTAPAVMAVPPIEWPVTDFSLQVSESIAGGVRYRILERFPLPL